MRVTAVAQAFKETLTLAEVAGALESGIRAAGGEANVLRASDGGDGLLDALVPRLGSRSRHKVTGPLGRGIDVEVGWLSERSALVESRLICGLDLVPQEERDPSRTTTRGVGEIVIQLVQSGATQVFVGLGGSATVDGGVGMARSWGWVPLDAHGRELPEGGGSLEGLGTLRPGSRPSLEVTGLVDVRSPLNGPHGARVFAGQKGASAALTDQLSRGLERLTEVTVPDGGGAMARLPGAGAAGGLGFGILFFAGGVLVAGAPWVLERAGFRTALLATDLVLCAEGAFDETSLDGKLTGTVIAGAQEAEVAVGLLAPRATAVPEGVMVETGGSRWTADDLARRTETLVRRALRSARGD